MIFCNIRSPIKMDPGAPLPPISRPTTRPPVMNDSQRASEGSSHDAVRPARPPMTDLLRANESGCDAVRPSIASDGPGKPPPNDPLRSGEGHGPGLPSRSSLNDLLRTADGLGAGKPSRPSVGPPRSGPVHWHTPRGHTFTETRFHKPTSCRYSFRFLFQMFSCPLSCSLGEFCHMLVLLLTRL